METVMRTKITTEKLYKKLMKEKNVASSPNFSPRPSEEIRVHLRPDDSVSPARFVPDPLMPGGHKAHPLTIRALRKDIFVQGEDEFSVLEMNYRCYRCNNEMDVQFWKSCPYCSADIDL